MKKYTCFTNNDKPLLGSGEGNFTIIKRLIMTTYMHGAIHITEHSKIGTHVLATTGIY